MMQSNRIALLLASACLAFAAEAIPTAFVGARIIDGTGKTPIEKATILVRDGRIQAIGTSVSIPAGTRRLDVAGKTIIPGLINAHGHVSNLDQLGLYARYGVTTVFSLGGDKEIELRDRTRA